MKHIYTIFLVLCVSPCAFAGQPTTTIQIIMDDSGVLIEPAKADSYKIIMLSHIKKLVRKREFARANIDVISSSMGRTIWSGTPSDLKRKPERALALVNAIKAVPENCNNLSGAFMELASNLKALRRQGFTRVRVIIFSSLIHTPRPCSDMTKIILPQEPPLEGNINGILMSSKIIRSVQFFWVSTHQRKLWEEFLEPSFNWAERNSVPMTLMDIERSTVALKKGLSLEVRK